MVMNSFWLLSELSIIVNSLHCDPHFIVQICLEQTLVIYQGSTVLTIFMQVFMESSMNKPDQVSNFINKVKINEKRAWILPSELHEYLNDKIANSCTE